MPKFQKVVKHFQFRLLRFSTKQRKLLSYASHTIATLSQQTQFALMCRDTNRTHTNWIQANRSREGNFWRACVFARICIGSWRVLEHEHFSTAFIDNRCLLFDQTELRHEYWFSLEKICWALTTPSLPHVNFYSTTASVKWRFLSVSKMVLYGNIIKYYSRCKHSV